MNRRLETPKVKDILIKKIIKFKPNLISFDAISILKKHNISGAPVINDRNEVIGHLAEGDCIRYLSQSLFYDENLYQTVDMIMSKNISFAKAEWDIFELEDFFSTTRLRSAPVIDLNKHLIGIVTRREVLIALEEFIEERQQYKKEIKTPVELDFREKVKIIMNRYRYIFQ